MPVWPTCPIVRVVSPESPGGYKVINESDLTPQDEIWREDEKRERPEQGAEAASVNAPLGQTAPSTKRNNQSRKE